MQQAVDNNTEGRNDIVSSSLKKEIIVNTDYNTHAV